MPRRKGYSKQITDTKQGRPAIGITRKVSVTLDQDQWEWLTELVSFGQAKSYSEIFRTMVTEYRGQVIE